MSQPPAKPMPVSAYIPCYNNAKTVCLAVQGIQRQTRPVDELFVVDDGSTDNSAELVEGLGVRVLRMGKNQGRGAVRARAMETAQHEFVLCCDATNELPASFLADALKWLSDEKIIAVFGCVRDRHPHSTVDRWRARHLFKQDAPHRVLGTAYLSTYGAVVRKSSTMSVGNYDPLLRHGEDFDLGTRLLTLGNVVLDPALEVQPVNRNTLYEVMERYTRWNRASMKSYSITDFIDSNKVTWKILIPRDIKNHDWRAALISATVPFFSVFLADKISLTFPPRAPLEEPVEFERKS